MPDGEIHMEMCISVRPFCGNGGNHVYYIVDPGQD